MNLLELQKIINNTVARAVGSNINPASVEVSIRIGRERGVAFSIDSFPYGKDPDTGQVVIPPSIEISAVDVENTQGRE